MTVASQTHRTDHRAPPNVVTLILLTALSTLSLSMFLPSLTNIARDLEADYALVNMAVAGYAATTALLQLIIGPLSDRYGRRPVMLACIALFIVASIGCLLASDVWTFLAFRLLQGAIIAGWVISAAIVRDMHAPQDAASVLGYISMAMAVAPMLGPMIGGTLDDHLGWRASFVVFVACGAIMFAICWRDLGETNASPSATFAAQFATYPELFRSPRFWGYATCMASTTAAFYSYLGGIPLVVRALFDMSNATLGMYIGVTTVGFFVGSFLAGRAGKLLPLTTMMLIGRGVACAGLSIGLVLFATIGVDVYSLFGAAMCVGLGNGITLPASGAGVMSVRPDLAGSAAGLSGALTLGAGAATSAITGLLLTGANGAYVLIGIMLLVSLAGLAAAFWVRHLEARHAANA